MLGGLPAITVPAGVYQVQTSDSGYLALAQQAGPILDMVMATHLAKCFSQSSCNSLLACISGLGCLAFFVLKKTTRTSILQNHEIVEGKHWGPIQRSKFQSLYFSAKATVTPGRKQMVSWARRGKGQLLIKGHIKRLTQNGASWFHATWI